MEDLHLDLIIYLSNVQVFLFTSLNLFFSLGI